MAALATRELWLRPSLEMLGTETQENSSAWTAVFQRRSQGHVAVACPPGSDECTWLKKTIRLPLDEDDGRWLHRGSNARPLIQSRNLSPGLAQRRSSSFTSWPWTRINRISCPATPRLVVCPFPSYG